VYKVICSNISKSPQRYNPILNVQMVKNKHNVILSLRGKPQQKIIILEGKASDMKLVNKYYISMFSCIKLMSLYKCQSHVVNCCHSKLNTVIEKNPNIDPSKTITVPYSQGNVAILGQNAGQQCVAMSLCSLIYYINHGINSSSDLGNIMNIGNQLYSSRDHNRRI
jgi:hypothetical protein